MINQIDKMMNNAAGFPGVFPNNTVSTRPVLKMSRVVSDQKTKFESDELFRKLSTDSAICYTGYKELDLNQRRLNFFNFCCQGRTEIAFKATGICLQLVFNPSQWPSTSSQEIDCDFDTEIGRAHIKYRFIMNGVCVKFRGWLDRHSLEGVGRLEFDEERAFDEDAIGRNVEQKQMQFLLDFLDRQRAEFGQTTTVMEASNGGGLWRPW